MKVYKLAAFLFAFLLLASSCQKDKEKLIIGTWEIKETHVQNLDKYLEQFKDKYQASDKEIEREKSRVEALPEAYYPSGITMSFKENGVYDLGGITGKWTYDKDSNNLVISLATLDKSIFNIKSVSKKKLVLIYPFKMADMNLNFELVLQRVKSE